MKKRITLRSLMSVLLISTIGMFTAYELALPVVATGLILFAVSFIPQMPGALTMAIQREIWENDLVENLFKDNTFLNYAVNADQYVLAGKVVHIPNAGGAPSVKKNRTELPAQITKRTDVDITYSLDEFTSDPIHVDNAEMIEPSYDKRASVMADSQQAINEYVAEQMLLNWAPTAAASIIRTSGSAIVSHLPSATGNRKKFLPADLKSAGKKMTAQGIAKTDRYAMFSAEMEDQFTDGLTATQYTDFSRAYDEKNGVIGKLFGFTILSRETALRYTNAATPVLQDMDAAAAATDNDGVLCWQKQCVERAIGQVKVFEDNDNPTMYGDIMSCLLRAGGRKRRNDAKGVIAIVQDSTT
jgi:hypothetical protein